MVWTQSRGGTGKVCAILRDRDFFGGDDLGKFDLLVVAERQRVNTIGCGHSLIHNGHLLYFKWTSVSEYFGRVRYAAFDNVAVPGVQLPLAKLSVDDCEHCIDCAFRRDSDHLGKRARALSGWRRLKGGPSCLE